VEPDIISWSVTARTLRGYYSKLLTLRRSRGPTCAGD
jgi:hypothetical protein